MGHTVGVRWRVRILIRVTVAVRVRTTLMDSGRARYRGSEGGFSVRVQDVGCARSVVGCCRVVVLRAAVSVMGFERVRFGVNGSDRWPYANPNANS